MDMLITTEANARRKAYPLTSHRVTSRWGTGRLVYATSDGYVGLELDGETRVDEYPAQHVRAL